MCKPVHFHTRYEFCGLCELLWCSNIVHYFSLSFLPCALFVVQIGYKIILVLHSIEKSHLENPPAFDWSLFVETCRKHVSGPCSSWYFSIYGWTALAGISDPSSVKRWHTVISQLYSTMLQPSETLMNELSLTFDSSWDSSIRGFSESCGLTVYCLYRLYIYNCWSSWTMSAVLWMRVWS